MCMFMQVGSRLPQFSCHADPDSNVCVPPTGGLEGSSSTPRLPTLYGGASVVNSHANSAHYQCRKVFTSRRALERHVSRHDSHKWVCSLCAYRFKRKVLLRKHWRDHHFLSLDSLSSSSLESTGATAHNAGTPPNLTREGSQSTNSSSLWQRGNGVSTMLQHPTTRANPVTPNEGSARDRYESCKESQSSPAPKAKNFMCNVCGAKFYVEESLRQHELREHDEESSNVVFESSDDLEECFLRCALRALSW